jgi:hypothetical protein
MENIKVQTIKEQTISKQIVNEIRSFGVNDNIICMIIEQLSLDLVDINLMKDLRNLLKNRSEFSKLKEICIKELEEVTGLTDDEKSDKKTFILE